jgi:hypothetical protein
LQVLASGLNDDAVEQGTICGSGDTQGDLFRGAEDVALDQVRDPVLRLTVTVASRVTVM